MTDKHSIKRGVSLYSYQEEFFLQKMSLKDCITAAAATGATGIEIIGEQSIWGFPKLTDAFVDQWFGWMDKYGVTPICHDQFLDFTKFKGKYFTEEEALQSLITDMKFANRLGIKIIRLIMNAPLALLVKALPYAEQYDVILAMEVHSPFHMNHAWITKILEAIDKTGTKHLGLIPDMGIFVKRMPRVVTDRLLREGADEKLVQLVCDRYEKGELADYIIAEVAQLSKRPIDMVVAEHTRFYTYTNPASLLPYMSHIVHIHAKFFEMLDDGTEYSIPYEDIIPILIKGGYSGYLASEYEGNRHIQDVFEVDSVEQVSRQQEMFKRLLGEEVVAEKTKAVKA